MFGFFHQMPLVARLQLPDGNFNQTAPNNLELVNKRIERFKQAQALLLSTDRNIVLGLAVGSACWLSTYLFPLVTVSIAGFCFATYNLCRRAEYFKQYQEALNDLIEVYQWSMGRGSHNLRDKLAVKEIQTLILTLGPCASSKTIHTWTNDDLKPLQGTAGPLNSFPARRNDITEEFEQKLKDFAAGTQTSSRDFTLYGEGGTDDLLGTLQANIKKWMKEIFSSAVVYNAASL